MKPPAPPGIIVPSPNPVKLGRQFNGSWLEMIGKAGTARPRHPRPRPRRRRRRDPDRRAFVRITELTRAKRVDVVARPLR